MSMNRTETEQIDIMMNIHTVVEEIERQHRDMKVMPTTETAREIT